MSEIVSGGARAWTITALCASFMSINYADKVIVGLAAVPIMAELHLNPSEFGLLGSAFFLLYSVSAVAVGFIADRVATRWIIAAAALVWALTLLPMAGAASFSILILSRIILGAAEGPSIAIANHCVFEWFEGPERPLPSSIVSIGSSIGVLFSAPALAWVIKTYDWHMAFLALSLAGLVWIPIWLIFAKEGPLSSKNTTSRMTEVSKNEPLPSLWPLLTQRTFFGALACAYVAFSVLALVVAWLPPLLINGEKMPAVTASWIVALAWAIESVCVVLAGWYSTRLATRGASARFARGYLAAGAVCLSGLALMFAVELPTTLARVSMLVLAFSAAQAVWPLLFALLSEISPASRRGSVTSTFTALFTTAGLAVPALMGYLVQMSNGSAEGYYNGLLYLGAFTLVGGLLGFWLINPESDRNRLALRRLQEA
jgi:MFS family permease